MTIKTYPCTKRGCPPGCPDPVVFVEGIRPPYTIPMHLSEYLAHQGMHLRE